MTEDFTLDSNLLITKYMDVDVVERNGEPAVFMSENFAFPEYWRCTRYNRYHLSWDQLMTVVKKIGIFSEQYTKEHIRNLEQHYKFNGLKIHSLYITSDFETVYNSVVEFINWYNIHIE